VSDTPAFLEVGKPPSDRGDASRSCANRHWIVATVRPHLQVKNDKLLALKRARSEQGYGRVHMRPSSGSTLDASSPMPLVPDATTVRIPDGFPAPADAISWSKMPDDRQTQQALFSKTGCLNGASRFDRILVRKQTLQNATVWMMEQYVTVPVLVSFVLLCF